MQRKEETRTLDGLKVTVRQLPPRVSLRAKARIVGIIAPFFEGIGLEGANMAALKFEDVKIKPARLAEAFRSLADETDWAIDTFLAGPDADVTVNGVPFSVALDSGTIGDDEVLQSILLFALEVNYARFFAGNAVFGALLQKAAA